MFNIGIISCFAGFVKWRRTKCFLIRNAFGTPGDQVGNLCTMVTGKRLGHPVRSLRTPFARNYAKAEYGGMPDEELEALGAGKLRMAVQEGDAENGCFLSGQIAAMVNQEQPAADIVREVVEEAEVILRRATAWVE